MSITVSIPCKPYIKHWLEVKYGCPIRLPRNCSFKAQLLSCLTKEFQPKAYYNNDLYPSSVEVAVGKNEISTFGVSVAPQMHHFLHRTIREQLELNIFIFVTSNNLSGSSIESAIKAYQTIHGFSEEIFSYDAIRSIYFRYKKNIQKEFPKTATKIAA